MKASKVFMLDDIFYKLTSQDTKFPLKIGYAVYKMARQISEAAEYIGNRLCSVIDEKRMRLGDLTDDEQLVYKAVMDSDIDIKPFEISKDELFRNDEVSLTLQEIAEVDELFGEN